MIPIVIGDLAPFLTELVNCSLSTGCVPEVFKEAYITPRLKTSTWTRPMFDHIDPFRTISNIKTVGEDRSATARFSSQLRWSST